MINESLFDYEQKAKERYEKIKHIVDTIRHPGAIAGEYRFNFLHGLARQLAAAMDNGCSHPFCTAVRELIIGLPILKCSSWEEDDSETSDTIGIPLILIIKAILQYADKTPQFCSVVSKAEHLIEKTIELQLRANGDFGSDDDSIAVRYQDTADTAWDDVHKIALCVFDVLIRDPMFTRNPKKRGISASDPPQKKSS